MQISGSVFELTDRCMGLTLVSGVTMLRSMFSATPALITVGIPAASFLHGFKLSCTDVPEPSAPALPVSGA